MESKAAPEGLGAEGQAPLKFRKEGEK